jgi:ribosomal protein S18 acetylase RimI-like enzyme
VEVEILAAEAVSAAELDTFLQSTWGAGFVVAHGERIVPTRLPGFVARSAGRVVGHASYRIVDDACEVTSIAADPPRAGIGSQLMSRIEAEARLSGCSSVWLTTTNDNLDALRFYQRRGFGLVTLRRGAVDVARRDLKPAIPELGSYGIPMRDELDLALRL